MRHRKKGRKLSRKKEHRKSLLINLTKDLIKHGKVDTTLAKAKEAQRYAERVINIAKREDSTSSRRQAFRLLQDKEAVKLLFDEVAARYKERDGGYTRVVKLPPRRGDGAEMARLMLV